MLSYSQKGTINTRTNLGHGISIVNAGGVLRGTLRKTPKRLIAAMTLIIISLLYVPTLMNQRRDWAAISASNTIIDNQKNIMDIRTSPILSSAKSGESMAG